MEKIVTYLKEKNWEITYSKKLPAKKGEYFSINNMPLSEGSKKYLRQFTDGIYKHQKSAIENFCSGKNVIISTSTASGKSLIFYVTAIEKISVNPNAKIIAVYPMKALAVEQEERWKEAVSVAEINASVGRIDGSVSIKEREKIISQHNIIIITPDTIHAWLLSNLASKHVFNLIQNTEMVIVDEAHVYSGVFGSTSAYLFRRLNHAITKTNKTPIYVAASATIKNPLDHMKSLVGLDFLLIDDKYDTAPKHSSNLIMVEPPAGEDINTTFSAMLKFLSGNISDQFIAFVDSRKQAEYIASIANRKKGKEETVSKNSEELNIMPFRAGYEEFDRNAIQKSLANGTLKGVVSTSALEMGIDIPGLSLGILFGIPSSATSFYQRIGRIGRQKEGTIIIINNGSIISETIFMEPDSLFNMPLTESTLYLENRNIQYIQALCLASEGGEDDIINQKLGIETDKLETEIDFPDAFIKICENEKVGEVDNELRSMKTQSNNDPHHTFPLRDVESQYKIEVRSGRIVSPLGYITRSQMMREAYPGAIYYYKTIPHRIVSVSHTKKTIEARRERNYTTKPIKTPTLIYPNLHDDTTLNFFKLGNLIIAETELQVNEHIIGYEESRGPNTFKVEYPLDYRKGAVFNQPKFSRNYFTSGVLINHPALNRKDVKINVLAELLFETFLTIIPLERRDISYGSDKWRKRKDFFGEGERFISIFDQTYNSLRLTSQLANLSILREVINKSFQLIEAADQFQLDEVTLSALKAMSIDVRKEAKHLTIEEDNIVIKSEKYQKVILPGSKGINLKRNNEEFFIERILYKPEGLCYIGKNLSQMNDKFKNSIISVPVHFIGEIPDISETGYYNYETGEVTTSAA